MKRRFISYSSQGLELPSLEPWHLLSAGVKDALEKQEAKQAEIHRDNMKILDSINKINRNIHKIEQELK